MKVKLSNDNYKVQEHGYICDKNRDERNKILKAHAGEWIDVDTEHLFNNQYNVTIENVGFRVMDSQITAVCDDIRPTSCNCKYCGKTFTGATLDDAINAFNEHINALEKNCEKCFYNRSKIIDTKRETKKETAANGDVIETNTTVYTWHKACDWHDNDGTNCVNEQHAKYGYETFTAANTYFIKYPNGYDGYFKELSYFDAWRELHFHECTPANVDFTRMIQTDFVGTYSLYIDVNNDATIRSLTLENSRHAFTISGDTLTEIFTGHFYAGYPLFRKVNAPLANFPKTLQNTLCKNIETLRDSLNRDYVKETLFPNGIIKGV